MDIPVKKRFRQTRYTCRCFRLGIKLFCADRRLRRRKNLITCTSNETPRYISDTRSETLVRSAEKATKGQALRQYFTRSLQIRCTLHKWTVSTFVSNRTLQSCVVAQNQVDIPLKEPNKKRYELCCHGGSCSGRAGRGFRDDSAPKSDSGDRVSGGLLGSVVSSSKSSSRCTLSTSMVVSLESR